MLSLNRNNLVVSRITELKLTQDEKYKVKSKYIPKNYVIKKICAS